MCVRACVRVSESVCPKTCHHIARRHDANNVSNVGGDPMTQLNVINVKQNLRYFTGTVHHSRDATTGFAAVATRSRAGCWRLLEYERPTP